MATTIDIRGVEQVPHLDQFFGPWAMETDAFSRRMIAIAAMDLPAHVAEFDAEAAQADFAEGYGYTVDGDGIAVVEIVGPMSKHYNSFEAGTSTIMMRRDIRNAARDERVRGILIKIDSPGGTVSGNDELAQDIVAAGKQKPVHAFIEDMGASAAYWQASQTDRITVNRTGIVGSIGTYGVLYDQSEQFAQAGIRAIVVRAGEFKGVGEPGTEITEEHIAELQSRIDKLNDHFIRAVADGRGWDLDKARSMADGRVSVGEEALANGLVDAVGTFDDALAALESETSNRRKGATMAKSTEGAASFADLKAALIGADAEFICQCLEADATLDEASELWMQEQNERLQASQQQAIDAQAAADEAANKGNTGVDPVGSGGASTGNNSAGNNGTAREEFFAIVSGFTAKGMDRKKAIAKAVRENPELHKQMTSEATAAAAR